MRLAIVLSLTPGDLAGPAPTLDIPKPHPTHVITNTFLATQRIRAMRTKSLRYKKCFCDQR
jgi:hypothetical protein